MAVCFLRRKLDPISSMEEQKEINISYIHSGNLGSKIEEAEIWNGFGKRPNRNTAVIQGE